MTRDEIRSPRWTMGAYSVHPQIARRGADEFIATCAVEAWRGTPAELVQTALTLRGLSVDTQLTFSVVTSSGEELNPIGPDQLKEVLSILMSSNGLALLRVSASSPTLPLAGVLLAKPQIPGIFMQLRGQDEVRLSGVIHTAYRAMMIGYVDRLGGLRAPVVMLTALAPMYIVGFAIDGGIPASSIALRLVLLALLAVASISIFVLGLKFAAVQRAFDLTSTPTRNSIAGIRGWLLRIYARPSIKLIIGGITTVILGAIGSELASLFPLK